MLDAGLLQLMATQQEVDLGIKVDFLINCIHWSDIYVLLALSETLWSGEKCVAQRQNSGRQTDALMLTVAHWYLRMKSCITYLKTDKEIQTVKVSIGLQWLLLRHKGLLLSNNVLSVSEVFTGWTSEWLILLEFWPRRQKDTLVQMRLDQNSATFTIKSPVLVFTVENGYMVYQSIGLLDNRMVLLARWLLVSWE